MGRLKPTFYSPSKQLIGRILTLFMWLHNLVMAFSLEEELFRQCMFIAIRLNKFVEPKFNLYKHVYVIFFGSILIFYTEVLYYFF